MNWLQMESAPKTGEDILLFCKDSNEQFVGYWHQKYHGWTYALCNGTRFQCYPDFWMPLPTAPTSDA